MLQAYDDLQVGFITDLFLSHTHQVYAPCVYIYDFFGIRRFFYLCLFSFDSDTKKKSNKKLSVCKIV